MDIYGFLNSRDIAEHCRKIGKTWNTFEMAAIINRSARAVEQKHSAWQELVDHYPNAPAPTKIIPWVSKEEFIMFGSVHAELTEIIKYEQRLSERFKMPEAGAVYWYKVWWSDAYKQSDTFFSTFEKVVIDAHDRWERDEAPKIVFEKIYIDDTISIEAQFDYDMNLQDIYFYGNENRRKEWFPDINLTDENGHYGANIFEWFYLDIPTPFKRGDILTYSANSGTCIGLTGPLVLEMLDRDNKESYERHLKWGDSSDMRGGGYSVSDEGVLVHTALDSYDELEYFRGELEGNDKLLHYVSLFLKDEIDLATVLAAQCRIIAEHQQKMCSYGVEL